jgi:hypothetical protein
VQAQRESSELFGNGHAPRTGKGSEGSDADLVPASETAAATWLSEAPGP